MAHFTPAGADRLGHPHEMGITSMRYKVVASDTNGGLLILEQSNREKGGPARHLHHDQDEWFYAIAGQFIVEVGTERFTLGPGDSLLAPRKVPHVWAFSGNGEGRLLVGFTPAGQMEGFFAAAIASIVVRSAQCERSTIIPTCSMRSTTWWPKIVSPPSLCSRKPAPIPFCVL